MSYEDKVRSLSEILAMLKESGEEIPGYFEIGPEEAGLLWEYVRGLSQPARTIDNVTAALLSTLQPGDIVRRKGANTWFNVEYVFPDKIVVKQAVDVMASELHAWERVNEYGRTVGAKRTPQG